MSKFFISLSILTAIVLGLSATAEGRNNNWTYDPPTAFALHIDYPSWVGQNPGNANHANIRIEDMNSNKQRTLNFHTGSRQGFYPEHTFEFLTHRDWPGYTEWCVTWVQVAETNYHWKGRVCTPPPTTTTTTTTTVPETTTTTTTTTVPETTTTTTTTIPETTTTTTVPETTTTTTTTTTTVVVTTTTTVPETTTTSTTTTTTTVYECPEVCLPKVGEDTNRMLMAAAWALFAGALLLFIARRK